ncbi:MAG: hypothetical protein ACPG4W_03120 [Flavobacteriales bacterium]
MRNKFVARLISTVFHPVFLPFLLIYWLVNQSLTPLGDDLSDMILRSVFVATLLIPLLTVLILKWSGLVGSIHLAKAEERRWPYSLSMFTFLMLSVLFYQQYVVPKEFAIILFGSGISIMFLRLYLSEIKISAHTTCAGGVAGALIQLTTAFDYPFFYPSLLAVLLAGLIGWARLDLRAHSQQEVYIGYGLGFVCQLFSSDLLSFIDGVL